MIRKLRIKFVAITTGVLLLVFIVIFVALNLFMQLSSTAKTDEMLAYIAQQDGAPAPPGNLGPKLSSEDKDAGQSKHKHGGREMMRGGRFFYAKINEAGHVTQLKTDNMYDFTQEDALSYVQLVLQKNSTKGAIENLQYLVVAKEYGKIVLFAERSVETQMLRRLIGGSVWLAVGSFVVLFSLSIFLARWATKPVQSAFEKQRRFVSDASHELKTPLTIILADADVLENEIGQNTWITHIKVQATRMSGLIQGLLSLAKADEGGIKTSPFTQFDLAKLCRNTTLEFESRAFEEGKALTYDIPESLPCTGRAEHIKQLLGILLDNALQHSGAEGQIKVTLQKQGVKTRLAVYNTGPGISHEERAKVFERFYRTDTSRSRESGGYGLGLSIAKEIVAAHRGTLHIEGEEGRWVEFIVCL